MSGASDVRLLVDGLLGAEKTLTGFGQWRHDENGVHRYTRAIVHGGEIVADLCIKAYPRNPQPCFRIAMMIMEIAVWRIDYTWDDKPHINSHDRPGDIPLGPFRQPHYHAWTDNRRFATRNHLPRRLKNARLMPDRIRTFEQALWWFCSEVRISATTGDMPELPKRDMLL